MQSQVDAQGQIAARPDGPDALDVLDLVAVAVLDDALGPVLTAQPVIEGQFRAFLAGVVDVGESQQVPGHLPRGVITAVLPAQIHAADVQFPHLAGIGGLEPAPQVEERAVQPGADAPQQL